MQLWIYAIYFLVECFDGFCVNENKEHVIERTSNITGEHTKEACLAACKEKRAEAGHMTACEWRGKNECLFHTKPISNGNGDPKYQCCVFNKGESLWRIVYLQFEV